MEANISFQPDDGPAKKPVASWMCGCGKSMTLGQPTDPDTGKPLDGVTVSIGDDYTCPDCGEEFRWSEAPGAD